jgi:hypothetical protein
MGTLLVLIVAPILALAAMMLALIWVANRVADHLVGRKHRWLEEIVRTGEAPADWQTPFARRLARATRVPEEAAPRLRIQTDAQAAYLRRLDELIRYIAASPLVSDEESRDTLLAQLAGVREDWAARRPDQGVIGPLNRHAAH